MQDDLLLEYAEELGKAAAHTEIANPENDKGFESVFGVLRSFESSDAIEKYVNAWNRGRVGGLLNELVEMREVQPD